jgi:hypothetical protein
MSDWFDQGASGATVDVVAMLDSRASDVLVAIVSYGALVSLGVTSDGGALGVTVTVDGRWRREYFRDVDALVDWLTDAAPAVKLACDARTASSVPRSRQRRTRGL